MGDRATIIDAFLAGTAWHGWTRSPLAGDASARRYVRLSNGGETAILMDAPPENGEDTTGFVTIAEYLLAQGLTAPRILAHDAQAGLLLLSDLGTTDYVQWLARYPADEGQLYKAATDILLRLETVTPPTTLKRMTPEVGSEMIAIVGTHYSNTPTADLCQEMHHALGSFAPEPDTLALRDYHAENLIWRPERTGLDRVGLLDFQDALVAPAGYDLMSLLRDARRDVALSVAEDTIAYFADHTKAKHHLRTTLACLGVQRNLRILGVFARLVKDLGKPRYLAFMPRVWGHIVTDLKDPALADLRQAVMDTVPAPTPDHLAGLHP